MKTLRDFVLGAISTIAVFCVLSMVISFITTGRAFPNA